LSRSHHRPGAIILGSGYIADRHATALREAQVPILGVYSPHPGRAGKAAEAWGTQAIRSVDELLQHPQATHLHVCTPTTSHADYVTEAIGRELAVVCEKPLTVNSATAERLVSAVSAAGIQNYVTFNRRYDQGIQLFRSLYLGGEIGEAVSVYGNYQQEWNAPVSSRDWRFDPAQIGPSRVVSEIGSHWFDLAGYVLASDVVAVTAATGNMGEREFLQDGQSGTFTPENEDTFSALLRFGNGALGTVMATQLAHGAWDDITLRVDGTRGSILWTSDTPGRVEVAHKGRSITSYGVGGGTSSIETMIASIYGGTDTTCARFSDGLKNCAVQDAVLESSRNNNWTTVKEYS
jgi:predicted dehydrogenase